MADLARLVEWATSLAPLRAHRSLNPLPPAATSISTPLAGHGGTRFVPTDRPGVR
jgi:hypothetical protein